jgi:ParB family chromosome partitioning protein
MNLELSLLDRRYGSLRIQDAFRHSRLLESVLAHGQQVPVVVVADEEPTDRYVLIDGYLRVAVLEQLCRDEVEAQVWQMPEGRALALAHRLDNTQQRTALEEGWLLVTLEREHGMSLGELAILLGRSRSWVSRRLGLVNSLPKSAQAAVLHGRVSAQAAQRYLLPLARANTAQCETLIAKLGSDRISVRQMRDLYVGWRGGDAATRQRIVESPQLFLAAHEAVDNDETTRDELVRDLTIVTSITQRAQRRVDNGALSGSSASRTRRVKQRWRAAERALSGLGECLEEIDAELGDANSDPAAEAGGPRHPHDRTGCGRVAQRGQAGHS